MEAQWMSAEPEDRNAKAVAAVVDDHMLAADYSTLVLKHGSDPKKLATVQWEDGPNGLGCFLHLPYFAYDKGLLGKYQLAGQGGTKGQIRLEEKGTTTRQRVKYAHHGDGEAHFSQTGKVFTRVRVRTRPLADYEGHLFTLTFSNLAALASEGASTKQKQGRVSAQVDWARDSVPQNQIGGEVVAFWTQLDRFGMRPDSAFPAGYSGPVRWAWEGQEYRGVVLRPPAKLRSATHGMAIGFRPHYAEKPADRSLMLFVGGFNDVGEATDPSAVLNFLALLHADRDTDFDEVERRLGSIDLDYQPAPAPVIEDERLFPVNWSNRVA
jgi:hypothetical protein